MLEVLLVRPNVDALVMQTQAAVEVGMAVLGRLYLAEEGFEDVRLYLEFLS